MRNVHIYIDLAFCLLVLPVMMVIFPVERWLHNFPYYVISYGVWLYALYAANRLATVPLLFRRKPWPWLGVGLLILSVAVTYIFSSISLYDAKPSIHDAGIPRVFPAVAQYRQAVWSLFMIVETFSFAVGLLIQINRQRSRQLLLEAQRDKARIGLYRAQIKPHFMFNTLNSLYGLFLTKNEKALDALEKFIAMMRYVHTTSSRDLVPLSKETDYIQQYVGLQTLRLTGMTDVRLDIDVTSPDLKVPPMLLVTFVENCFKYGISPVEKSVIHILLAQRGDMMTFSTTNRIFPAKKPGEGSGIENCCKRLELLYPGRHAIKIENDGKNFKVNLSIKLL